jgi:hypothetical protein
MSQYNNSRSRRLHQRFFPQESQSLPRHPGFFPQESQKSQRLPRDPRYFTQESPVFDQNSQRHPSVQYVNQIKDIKKVTNYSLVDETVLCTKIFRLFKLHNINKNMIIPNYIKFYNKDYYEDYNRLIISLSNLDEDFKRFILSLSDDNNYKIDVNIVFDYENNRSKSNNNVSSKLLSQSPICVQSSKKIQLCTTLFQIMNDYGVIRDSEFKNYISRESDNPSPSFAEEMYRLSPNMEYKACIASVFSFDIDIVENDVYDNEVFNINPINPINDDEISILSEDEKKIYSDPDFQFPNYHEENKIKLLDFFVSQYPNLKRRKIESDLQKIFKIGIPRHEFVITNVSARELNCFFRATFLYAWLNDTNVFGFNPKSLNDLEREMAIMDLSDKFNRCMEIHGRTNYRGNNGIDFCNLDVFLRYWRYNDVLFVVISVVPDVNTNYENNITLYGNINATHKIYYLNFRQHFWLLTPIYKNDGLTVSSNNFWNCIKYNYTSNIELSDQEKANNEDKEYVFNKNANDNHNTYWK